MHHSRDRERGRASAPIQKRLTTARLPPRLCTLGRSDAVDDRRWPSYLTALPLCEFLFPFSDDVLDLSYVFLSALSSSEHAVRYPRPQGLILVSLSPFLLVIFFGALSPFIYI